MGGVIILVSRGGNAVLDGIGESDTKNEAKVVTNDASPRRTDVYEGELATASGPCSDRGSSVSCRFHFCFCAL